MLRSKNISSLFFLSFIVFVLFAFSGNLYAKEVCRMIDGIWTEADNPYNVTCGLLIPKGKTLTIKEGVKIIFTKKGLGLKVQGNLIIQGSSSKKVILSSTNKPNEKWNGLDVESGGTLKISNCLIEHAIEAINIRSGVNEAVIDKCVITGSKIRAYSKSIITNNEIVGQIYLENGDDNIVKENKLTNGAIYIDGNSRGNLIENNTINTNNRQNGIEISSHSSRYIGGSATYSNGNKITGNKVTNSNWGIYISGGSLNVISDNVIKNNKNGGIYLGNGTVINNIIVENNGYGITVSNAVKINHNEIYGNTKGDIDNSGSSEIDATNNWWGTSDESKIISRIGDYFQDANKGIVKFQPYLKMKPND